MGTGQFCTNPGLVVLPPGEHAEAFIESVAQGFRDAAVGTMLSGGVQRNLEAGLKTLVDAGAETVAGGESGAGNGFCHPNTLLRVSGSKFLADPETLQTEAFGNASLIVTADSTEQTVQIAESLEGNLTGCIYSHTGGADDGLYDQIAPALRQRVGRLLNDKMPTGVAVSAAMNHGGPFPATGHPGFTAVGMPASIRRFTMLQCYDNVRPHRLPAMLRD